MRQPDLFESDSEPDLFGERESIRVSADPDKVRGELLSLLAKLKAAQTLPWSREDMRYHQTVFPQMSRWLPEDEAAQLCFEFNTELKRLLAA